MQLQRSYMIKYAVIAVVVLFAVHHAYTTSAAATAQPMSTNHAAAATTPTEAQPTVQQQLTTNLQKSGFTDIKIVPDSFLVQAKDQSGNPVTLFLRKD